MRHSGPYQPFMGYEQPLLWMPSTGTDATGAGVGPPWVTSSTCTVATVSVGTTYQTQFRRTRFSSSGGNADENLGVNFNNSDVCCLWRGNSDTGPTIPQYRGGFFYLARFIATTIPASTTVRLFAGVSAQVGTDNAVCQSNTVPANTMGLWIDTTDSLTFKLVTCDSGATATKATLGAGFTLTAGELYEFRMIVNPNQSVVVNQLFKLGTLSGGERTQTLLATQNTSSTLPSATTFMAPQVGMSNGTANLTAADTEFDVVCVYARPNLGLTPAEFGI